MADSFLDSAGGWTPVPDKLVRDYGFEVAYVWGKVWRYCQMQNGACTASHETIAKRAGMSRRTLIDKLNILIEAGYIEDKTPDLKNKPHTYCTRIGEDKITSAMQISHTEIDIPAQDNELGMRNLHSDNADNAQPDAPTMQNLHPKRVSSNPESNLDKESLKVLSPKQKIFNTLAELCRINLRASTEKQRGQLGTTGKALIDLITDIDQFKEKFPKYWKQVDWRGKQGQPPIPSQIQEVYGDYCHWLENGEPAQPQKASTNGTHQRSNEKSTDRPATYDKSAHDAELEALANPRAHPG